MASPIIPKHLPPSHLISRAEQVHTLLMAQYGAPDWRSPFPPLDELVSTVLSQNTNDRNRDAAFELLRSRFPTWGEVRDAPTDQVIDAIRTAGLANQKGPRIQAILKHITEERGELELDFLKEMPDSQVFQWLTDLKGVGPKTATIVMLFSLGMRAFPVDTHIYRVTGRLGLRPSKMRVEDAHAYLAAQFPTDSYGPAHLNIIRLGREICTARKTNCTACPLQQLCDYAQANGIS
jgi:endonuclease III